MTAVFIVNSQCRAGLLLLLLLIASVCMCEITMQSRFAVVVVAYS